MTIASIIVFVFALYYFTFLIRIRIGLRKSVGARTPGEFPRASIVVAARNEEHLIEQCVRSLSAQSYPGELLEIIVVDDCSTDTTRSVLKKLQGEHPMLKVLSMADKSSEAESRKTQALEYGISNALGTIVLTTDADCVVSPRWAETMVAAFDDDTAMVVGPVSEDAGRSLLSRISQVEFLGIVTTAGGLIGTGHPIICNGANLAFRVSAFKAAGGYGHRNNFIDDEVLMQRIAYRKIGRVQFCHAREAVVATKPVETLFEFWHQRIRWAAKRGSSESARVTVTLLLIYVSFLAFLSAIALTITIPDFALFGGMLLAAKLIAEFQVISTGAMLFGQQIPFSVFLIAEVFHIPYVVLAGAAGQFLPKRWKGRAMQ